MTEPYRDRIVVALLEGDEDKATRLMTEALDGIAAALQTLVRRTPQPDFFLLVPMLRSVADQLETVMSPRQRGLATKMRERIVGITYPVKEAKYGDDAGADRE